MKEVLFQGVCTALVTPFYNGKVNYPMLQQLLRRQIDAGVKAIVLSGTTGESSTLSDCEKIELFGRGKDYVGDQCAIIAGTGSNSTEHAVYLSKCAQSVGVDGLLIVSPYYNKATPDGLYAHYLTIANNVDLPIILYNVPSRTGVDIPVSVYQRLSAKPNIIGVKEASTSITKITNVLSSCSDFSVWAGNDDMTVPILALGGIGVVSVLSNVDPEDAVKMTNSALSGDFIYASSLQKHFQPLIDLLFCEVNPIPVKAAMKMIGYDCGECRLPLTTLSKEHQQLLANCLIKKYAP